MSIYDQPFRDYAENAERKYGDVLANKAGLEE